MSFVLTNCCTLLLTYLFTPWSRVLLEKLTGFQLVKKFPVFYGTRRFITAITSVRHLSLSWASSIQSTHLQPTSWGSILILSSHLRLGFFSGPFPSGFPTKKPVHAPPLPNMRYMLRPFSFSILSTEPYCWGVQIIKFIIMHFSPIPYHLVRLRLKYSFLQLMSLKYFYKLYLIDMGNMIYSL